MHLAEIEIKNFRQFGTDPGLMLELNPGVTALVGENDAGKTAVMDAIRYCLLTRDSEYIRVSLEDFHIDNKGETAEESTIRCKIAGLSTSEKGAFVEYLTYDDSETVLYVYWRARRITSLTSRRVADVTVHSGHDGMGPTLDPSVRQLLAAAYLRPLRDAEREMAPGQGSRLSQVLSNYPGIDEGTPFDNAKSPARAADANGLSLVAMFDFLRHLVNQHVTVKSAQKSINESYLSQLILAGERLHGQVSFADLGSTTTKLRHILERLRLNLMENPSVAAKGRFGLGSNNLLFMACELLLLAKDPEGLPLLLIEEPEAHLHPQRQLRLMDFLLSASKSISGERPVQVLVSTHSPNLSSRIPLSNIVLIDRSQAFPLAPGKTKLSAGDYRFLQRFLDSTKANMFFARGLLIVEGDAEAILLPYLAGILGRDLTEYGISVVNVGGTGLRRYARIMQRADETSVQPSIPVGCIADMDVMPDCAPEILGLATGDDDNVWKSRTRRWKAKRDYPDEKLQKKRNAIVQDDSGAVRTFVAENWTFEYDLAFAGLAEEVYTAAVLAKNDDPLNDEKKTFEDVTRAAGEGFQELLEAAGGDNEQLCSKIYSEFTKGRTASKATAAQYLIDLLDRRSKDKDFRRELPSKIPPYISAAILYVTQRPNQSQEPEPTHPEAS